MVDQRDETTLDQDIERAMRGELADIMPSFLRSVVVVPSGGPVAEHFEGFVPVLYDRAGVPMLAIFTSLEGARAVSDVAKYAMTMPGRELMAIMPESYGVVVNPGSAVGFELPPEGVAKVKQFLLEEAEELERRSEV